MSIGVPRCCLQVCPSVSSESSCSSLCFQFNMDRKMRLAAGEVRVVYDAGCRINMYEAGCRISIKSCYIIFFSGDIRLVYT